MRSDLVETNALIPADIISTGDTIYLSAEDFSKVGKYVDDVNGNVVAIMEDELILLQSIDLDYF
jgi:hypothetical protein